MAVHINPVCRWECKHCNTRDVTRGGETNRMHNCPGLHGITAPLTPEGVRCEIRVHEREDYIGGALVTLDGRGRPVMAVETVRGDGSNDLAVFADCATTSAEARM